MGSTVLAIDPGCEQSAWVLYNPDTGLPVNWQKDANENVINLVGNAAVRSDYTLAVESIASYGMAVGAEVFETCVWVGRFIERWLANGGQEPRRVYRREVKLHLCGTQRAKDTNIRQAIIDRYGPGKEKAVGLKATPGPLYGMKADCWQALGVALTATEAA